jgi:hypothetical protein
VNLPELQRWTQAYGLEWPKELINALEAPHPTNGTNGTNGTTAPTAEDSIFEEDGELPPPEDGREVFWL